MRINKIYIQNFKGIKGTKIIDLNQESALLMGPNGFGKTTIFDVLELCLTGKIYRTEQKDKVTNHSKDYDKPFYQNEVGKDVVVKVWLTKKDDDFIITKILRKDHDGRVDGSGRRNKPADFDTLERYRESPEDFSDNEFNPKKAKKIEQSDIDTFFGFKSDGFKIENIYNLFNYLQQEETTFFLKMSEKSRKEKLGFLFQTSFQEDELSKMSSTSTGLTSIREELNKKINQMEKVGKVVEVKYQAIFPEKDLKFDEKDLFLDVGMDESKVLKESYYTTLDDIGKFIERFSPEEYEKAKIIKLLDNKIKNNNLIDFYALQKLMEKKNYETLRNKKDMLENDDLIQAFILQKCSVDYRIYQNTNDTRAEYTKFLSEKDINQKFELLEGFVKELKPELLESYKELLTTRQQLIDGMKEIDLTITEIIRMRDAMKSELEKDKHHIIEDDTCLYCGQEWKTASELMINFEDRGKALEKLITNQSEQLSDLEKNIKGNYLKSIEDQMNDFLMKNKETDMKIMKSISDFKNQEFDFSALGKYELPKNTIWDQPAAYEDLLEVMSQVKEIIETSITVPDELFNKMKKLRNISLKTDIKELEEIISKSELNEFAFWGINKKITMPDYNNRIKGIRKILENEKKNYQYDDAKARDSEGMYKRYFNSNKEEFNIFKQEQLDNKKEYIKYLLSKKQSKLLQIYKERYKKLDEIIKEIDSTRDLFRNMINDHKIKMVNNIKVPFYIYTAKMLQNYQQGIGVFLSTSEGKDSIRFLTDQSTNHDAMHHLSSGQLAVVSLAFTLAINKTYNLSDNLKFLTIDDPVQEMDALNIHSFIELIRHEFLQDYQFIFSTHNDMNALYMKYKFERMNNERISMVNVQEKFFN